MHPKISCIEAAPLFLTAEEVELVLAFRECGEQMRMAFSVMAHIGREHDNPKPLYLVHGISASAVPS